MVCARRTASENFFFQSHNNIKGLLLQFGARLQVKSLLPTPFNVPLPFSSSLIPKPTMSIAALTCNSTPNPLNPSHRSIRRRNSILFMAIPTCRSINSRSLSLPELVFKIPRGSSKRSRNPICPRLKSVSPVMEWQNCKAKMEVDIPASVAYKCYSDREAIPKWMPFISSVKEGI